MVARPSSYLPVRKNLYRPWGALGTSEGVRGWGYCAWRGLPSHEFKKRGFVSVCYRSFLSRSSHSQSRADRIFAREITDALLRPLSMS